MIRWASISERVFRKILHIYYKRILKERTGQDVRTVKVLGRVDINNPNVRIGKNVVFRGHCIIDGQGPVIIGDDVRFNHGTILHASPGGGISIGDKTGIAAYSYIIDMDHGTKPGNDYHAQKDTVKPIVIGKNVWIAQNCTILKGSIIGDNAICAAKSVITGKNVPANAVVAGIPAKIIRFK